MNIRCPICKTEKIVEEQFEFRPFCSPTCKKLDLGNWLLGHYRLPRPLSAEEFFDLPTEHQQEIAQNAGSEHEES